MDIDINPQFQKALDLLENSRQSVFVTGRAGTGKSTLLNYWREKTAKKIVVAAPTGVAAVNINGQTIHKLFGFRPNIDINQAKKLGKSGKKKKLFSNLDTLVIDEVSMVRADLLDYINAFLQSIRNDKSPFGGLQVIFFGDLYQLPPVVISQEKEALKLRYVSPYFFGSDVLTKLDLQLVELETIYRQKDNDFINLLNAIRNNSVTDQHVEQLHLRFDQTPVGRADDYINLTVTNAQADEINNLNLDKLPGKTQLYKGEVSGEFGERDLPTDINLYLKVGARVMLLNNDGSKRWINGTLGTVTKLESDGVEVKLDEGPRAEVGFYQWTNYQADYDAKRKILTHDEVGSFTQLPLRLAWAITIHKSQGKTFDKVIVDVGRGTFAPGQLYVALSRCRTLEGLILRQKPEKRHVMVDYQVMKFMTGFQYKEAAKAQSAPEREQIIRDAIAQKIKLEIIYLKAKDEKSKRVILPKIMADMEFNGHKYLGLEAYCYERQADRVFNVGRILAVKLV